MRREFGSVRSWLHHGADLIDLAAVGGAPAAPLLAVHRPELAALVGPLVPDRDAVLAQVGDVGVAAQKPQQLVDDGAQVELLGGHQRKAGRQIEAHLLAEQRQRAGAGAVRLASAALADGAQQLQVCDSCAPAARNCRWSALAGRRRPSSRDAQQQHRQRQQLPHRQPAEGQIADADVRHAHEFHRDARQP